MLDDRGILFLLQSSDSMFPTGAYAHSFGMEEMVRGGEVADEGGVLLFLRFRVIPAMASVDLPLAAEARRASRKEDWERLWEIDELAGAVRATRELRAVCLQMGRRRLAALAALRPMPSVCVYQKRALADLLVGHSPSVWGAACVAVPERHALLALFYQSVSCFCAAAPKLLRMGQEAAQRVLTEALQEGESAVDRALAMRREDIGFFDPVLDLASMRHEIAEERLFIS